MMTPLNNQDLYSRVSRDSDSENYQPKTLERVDPEILERERNDSINQWYTPTSD